MTINHSNWRICLLSLALAVVATTNTASAFSSRSRRVAAKRGPASSTRHVFCYALAEGGHTMFSGTRKSSKRLQRQTLSRTELNYRAIDDDVLGYCDMADSSSYTDSLWRAALSPSEDLRQGNTSQDSAAATSVKITKKHSSSGGLIETAKAFIPVAIEIGVVAAAAANVHNLN